MQDKYALATAGIVVIGIMETAAIVTGVDGAYLTLCVGAIASIIGGVIGYSLPRKGS